MASKKIGKSDGEVSGMWTQNLRDGPQRGLAEATKVRTGARYLTICETNLWFHNKEVCIFSSVPGDSITRLLENPVSPYARAPPTRPSINIGSSHWELPPDIALAQKLVDVELVQLLHHGSLTYPLPGTSHPGGTKSSYQVPHDDDMDKARRDIQWELASSLGFPDTNKEQTQQGVAVVTKSEEVDEEYGWPSIRSWLAFDPKQRHYVDPTSLLPDDRIEGYSVLLNEGRELMACEASKVAKVEKRLNVTSGGCQMRSKALVQKTADLFGELQRGQVNYESFSRLRINENASGPAQIGDPASTPGSPRSVIPPSARYITPAPAHFSTHSRHIFSVIGRGFKTG